MTRFNAKKLMDEWIKSQDCQCAACNISIYRFFFVVWGYRKSQKEKNNSQKYTPWIASRPEIYLIIDFFNKEKSVWAVDLTNKS